MNANPPKKRPVIATSEPQELELSTRSDSGRMQLLRGMRHGKTATSSRRLAPRRRTKSAAEESSHRTPPDLRAHFQTEI